MRHILVVGGAGLIGAATALHLADLGHHVTIAGRRSPRSPLLAGFDFLPGSYLSPEWDGNCLGLFDTLVFAAGNDLRQMPAGADERAYFRAANSEGIPAFFNRARAAGIGTAVYVGSYYPLVLPPDRVEASGYLVSRRDADERVRALAAPGFRVCTLQSPFTVGHVAGVAAGQPERILSYCMRRLEPEGPRFAPPGGANFMSTRSFAAAVAGAIERGEAGRSYLMGDCNWSYVEYFNRFLKALGSAERAIAADVPNPAMPDISLYGGRCETIAYTPDPDTFDRLGALRGDAGRAIEELVLHHAGSLAGC